MEWGKKAEAKTAAQDTMTGEDVEAAQVAEELVFELARDIFTERVGKSDVRDEAGAHATFAFEAAEAFLEVAAKRQEGK